MRHLGIVLVLVLPALVLTSCSSSSDNNGAGPDVGSPTISSMSITDNQTDVGLVGKITATFSEPMDPATINDTTFVVGGRSATGYIDYDEDTYTASFLPDSLLAPETWHLLTISSDVTDEEGNHFEGGTTAFETGDTSCDNLLDHHEPDDDIQSATAIGLDEWVRTLTLCEGRANYDYFQFTLEETTKIRTRALLRDCIDGLGWITEFVNVDGEHYVNSGTSGDVGDTLGWYYTFLPGTYWVSVHSSESDPWGYAIYDFKLSTTLEPCRDDAFEDNDFIEVSADIGTGFTDGLVGCGVDSDWYWVEVDAGQTITVTVESDGGGHRRIRLWDDDLNQVGYHNGTDNPVTVSHTAVEDGVYFIMARFWTDGIDYSMDISAE